jgi:hypothetical protein
MLGPFSSSSLKRLALPFTLRGVRKSALTENFYEPEKDWITSGYGPSGLLIAKRLYNLVPVEPSNWFGWSRYVVLWTCGRCKQFHENEILVQVVLHDWFLEVELLGIRLHCFVG